MTRRAIAMNLDGLRRDMIGPETTPHLHAAMARMERFPDHATMFPSATRVVSASFATGCIPAHHELQGNTMALMEAGRIVVHDAGHPDFLQHKRRVTGRALARPTLAERLRDRGGAIVYSNVSPGAAYAHDPDGFGHVYHRAGSFGPGRKPVDAADRLDVTLDSAGDRAMTERFVADVVEGRRPAFGLLWLGDPDSAQHTHPLGSPEHLVALKAADAHAGLVVAAVDRRRTKGDDILLILASDHGHQTVTGVIDIDAELAAASLKAAPDAGDVVAVSNGTSALIYVHPDAAARTSDVAAFLRRQHWAARVIAADGLAAIGQSTANGLAFAVSMRSDDEPNAFGIRGRSLVAKPAHGKPDRMGCGQHGGLSRYEQSPFLMIDGTGFAAGSVRPGAGRVIDLAPTILTHLGLPATGMDGRPLQHTAS